MVHTNTKKDSIVSSPFLLFNNNKQFVTIGVIFNGRCPFPLAIFAVQLVNYIVNNLATSTTSPAPKISMVSSVVARFSTKAFACAKVAQ